MHTDFRLMFMFLSAELFCKDFFLLASINYNCFKVDKCKNKYRKTPIIFAESSYQAMRVLVVFASNVKRSDTSNSLPIFRMLVIFSFSFKTRIMRKFPARELLAFYSKF